MKTKVIVKPTLEQLEARNKRRKDKLSKMENAFQPASVYLDRWVQTNFKSEGGNVGGWEPFKLGGRRLKGGGIDPSAKLLQDTGRLRASFFPFATRRDGGIASDLPYAKVHHKGEGRLPERRLLPKKAEVIDKIRKIFKTFIGRAIK